MTTPHHNTAELAKLARVLDRQDPADLDFLATLPPAALRRFRDQITDQIAERESRRMQRIGAAAKLIPAPIAAKITEAAFGPVLAAAIAGSVDPSRAVAIASALSPSFLADATVTLDPRRATALIAEVPDHMAAATARELIARGDYLTLGRLAGSVPDRVLRAALPHAADIDLLHVGYYLEDTDAADRLLAIVTDRVPGMLRATAAENKWSEAITLLDLLGPTERSHLGNVVADQDPEILDALLTAVTDLDAWDTLLPVAAGMEPTALQRLADRPLMQDPTLLTKIADLALTHNLWLDLLPLADHLTPTQLHSIAARVAAEPDDSLTTLIETAHVESHWPALIPIALAMDTATRERLTALPVMHRPETLGAVITTAATHNLWPEALPLVSLFPPSTHPVLATHLTALSDNDFHAAAQAASAAEATTTVVQVLLHQDPAARAHSLALLDQAPYLEALVESLAPTDLSIWEDLSNIRAEIPDHLRALLAAQAIRHGRNELGASLPE
ncbi:hypothetical protein [Nocardia rhizosphaerihabitans]|uniref:Uncharacterized protein n=1 Tax=Nocardia rhizosphaerihabitans TaxID=1691570 RepID=A0ABQ2KV63_9NOCA|nr:hypothetical protein [Nocardia rhizosphaerihabitans]GGN94351.1 hypothetical protein GCM10011610_57210 [Nocardia rhizosphaerihabitans]